MSTYVSNHVIDCTSLPNFEDWSMAISAFMANIGWIQSNDTGQVVWTATVLTCTGIAFSGGTSVISYSSYTGPAPRVGMSMVFSTFSHGGNNSTFTLTAVSGGASGTVTVTNGSGQNDTTGSGTTTALVSVPTAGNYVYEIWGMGDNVSLGSTFYVKFDYGFQTTNTSPTMQITVATSTNGMGTMTGNISTRVTPSILAGAGSTLLEFDLSGGTNWFCILMGRNNNVNNSANYPRGYIVDRSRNSFGTALGTYVTVLLFPGASANNFVTQQSVFQIGSGTVTTLETASANRWATALPFTATTGTVGNMTMVSPVFPLVGLVDNPMLTVMVGLAADFPEGTIFQVTIYGAPHTYLFTKTNMSSVGNTGVGFPAIRWE